MSESLCPCGSGLAYAACCQRYHLGEAAPTAEALMRSRYTAYALGMVDYLLDSWHPRTRPAQLDMHDAPTWLGLSILDTHHGQVGDDEGEVEFEARFTHPDGVAVMHERSRFRRHEGRWVYLDGTPGKHRPGRNSACPCGSGKKYKRCCGR